MIYVEAMLKGSKRPPKPSWPTIESMLMLFLVATFFFWAIHSCRSDLTMKFGKYAVVCDHKGHYGVVMGPRSVYAWYESKEEALAAARKYHAHPPKPEPQPQYDWQKCDH